MPSPQIAGLQPDEGTTLPTGLNTDMAVTPADYGKFASTVKYGGPKDFQQDLSKINEERARVLGATQTANQNLMDLQTKQASDLATARAKAATEEKQKATAITAELDETRKKFPYPEFHPTQDNVQTLAGLFSIIGVIGMAMGGQGRLSAIGAKNSMSGMMNGWQQGSQQRFVQEKAKFDKDMAQIKTIIDSAKEKADESLKMLAYDRQEAEALAAESAAMMGGQIGRAMVSKGNLEQYYNFLNGLDKDINTKYDRYIIQANHRASLEMNKPIKYTLADGKTVYGNYAEHAGGYLDANGKRMDMSNVTKVEPLTGAGTGIRGGGGAINTRLAFGISEAFGQAQTDLVNVTKMPAGTAMGAFAELAGKSPDSMISSLSSAVARRLTDEDETMFRQLIAGLDQNMARALGGGYAGSTAKHLVDAYKTQMPRENDTAASTALFLARMKQELNILAKSYAAHPGANDQMIANVESWNTELNQVIPFNVSDVLKATNNARVTIGQEFKNLANESPRPPSLDVDRTSSGASQNVATRQDIEDTMAANPNMTRQQVIDAIKAKGYRVEESGF